MGPSLKKRNPAVDGPPGFYLDPAAHPDKANQGQRDQTGITYFLNRDETMTPKQLLRIVRRLPASTPVADTIKPPARYKTHKDHWIGWLSEYDGPGFYGRKNPDRDARYIWNHIQNVGMLVWLAEATGTILYAHALRRAAAYDLMPGAPSARCAAVRNLLPWSQVLKALGKP